MLGVSNCEIDSKKSAGAVTTSISHTSFSKGSPFWGRWGIIRTDFRPVG